MSDYHRFISAFKLITILVFIPGVLFSSGQNRVKKYVEEVTTPVFSIDPDSTNFSDFEMIGAAIGDAKIVMLGEQDHGDAPTFLAKTRLIKYLHEKQGFNVLAFESDFFGLNYGWDKLNKTPLEIDTFLRKNIFPIWTVCDACSNLFYNYIPGTYKTSSPLMISGFDNQMFLNYSSKNLAHALDSVIKSLDLPITKNPSYSSEIIPMVDSLSLRLKNLPSPDKELINRCDNYLNEIKKEMSEKLNKGDFWMAVIENLIRLNNRENNGRDFQMAANLKWLHEKKFADEKIIVWAANYHISKYGLSQGNSTKELTTMGTFFAWDTILMKETYVLGFTSYNGEAGRLGKKKYSVMEPESKSFENWINKLYNYSFTNFKNYGKKLKGDPESFYLKGMGHINLKRQWTLVYDGIFFIRKMYPCQKL